MNVHETPRLPSDYEVHPALLDRRSWRLIINALCLASLHEETEDTAKEYAALASDLHLFISPFDS